MNKKDLNWSLNNLIYRFKAIDNRKINKRKIVRELSNRQMVSVSFPTMNSDHVFRKK